MKNAISIRQGPEMHHIIPEHRLDFEQKVITCYEKSLKENDLKIYKLPHIEMDLFNYVMLYEPIHYVAARLSQEYDDEDFYEHHLKSLSHDAQFQFAVEHMQKFEAASGPINSEFDDRFYYDIVSVLEFHKMSFVDLGHINELGWWENKAFYRNLPWVRQVW